LRGRDAAEPRMRDRMRPYFEFSRQLTDLRLGQQVALAKFAVLRCDVKGAWKAVCSQQVRQSEDELMDVVPASHQHNRPRHVDPIETTGLPRRWIRFCLARA